MQTSRQFKNKFTVRAKHRLIDLGWNVTELAARVKRPRETVSRSINTKRFPHVRAAVAAELGIPLFPL